MIEEIEEMYKIEEGKSLTSEKFSCNRSKIECEPPGPDIDDDTSPSNAACSTTTVEYTDEDGNFIRFVFTSRRLLCFRPSTRSYTLRHVVKLYVNDKLKQHVGAVDYNATKGTIWTRPTRPIPEHGIGKLWFGGTICAEQREQAIKQLWSLVMRMDHIKWYGDVPLIDEVVKAPLLDEEAAATGFQVLASNEIWLHVYDLDKVTGAFNDAILRKLQLGMFHCGVEVFGIEYSFQGSVNCTFDRSASSGICKRLPKHNDNINFVYKECVHMGRAKISQREIEELVDQLDTVWRSDTYHLTRCNCLTFADAFSKAVGADVEFPLWIRNACEVSRNSSALDFITDRFWKLRKWWMSDDIGRFTCKPICCNDEEEEITDIITTNTEEEKEEMGYARPEISRKARSSQAERPGTPNSARSSRAPRSRDRDKGDKDMYLAPRSSVEDIYFDNEL